MAEPIIDDLLEDIQAIDVNDDADVEVQFAYHVTNVKGTEPQPTWEELQWNPADDCDYDGNILVRAPCVFFSTTTWNGGMPDLSPYPRDGDRNQEYWRVQVPLNFFDNYDRILFIHRKGAQVQLLLATTDDVKDIEPYILKISEQRARQYLRRVRNDQHQWTYYSNRYNYDSSYFVNFAVCRNVALQDAFWTRVTRGKHAHGKRLRFGEFIKNENLRQTLFNNLIRRINAGFATN